MGEREATYILADAQTPRLRVEEIYCYGGGPIMWFEEEPPPKRSLIHIDGDTVHVGTVFMCPRRLGFWKRLYACYLLLVHEPKGTIPWWRRRRPSRLTLSAAVVRPIDPPGVKARPLAFYDERSGCLPNMTAP